MSGLFPDLPEIRQEHLPAPWRVRLGPTGQAWIIAANEQPVINAAPELARRIVRAVNEAEAVVATPAEIDLIMRCWNRVAGEAGFCSIQMMSPDRRNKLLRLIKRLGHVNRVLEAIERIGRTPFLCGRNDRRWKASLDWFLQGDSYPRLMEGKYDDATGGADAFLDHLSEGNHHDHDGAERGAIGHHRAIAAKDARALPNAQRGKGRGDGENLG
jgi:hypothetical protein